MQNTWTYKNFEIREGLKPGSKTFRYFFRVLEDGKKKCNYCIWIVDDALTRFDPSTDFKAIVAFCQADWHQWVMGKIDGGDFRNRALKFEKTGEQEINLSEMKEHVRPD
ncbi:hypothetical protein [uncultured Desulfosarcina sp.]|uniref:hypothetical protein n=1 Tax=uncultured Desulfosarcina sp. TaxID=218289 RepID=UPI0029C6E3C6|nr:hypothetical protein [uncultured Desulfosarcina sp.]